MITKEQKLEYEPEIQYDLFAPRERIIFADIETTGLKAGKAQVYLIGAAGYEKGSWNLHQFFAESGEEEFLLLRAFSDYLNSKRTGQDHLILVTYNGDRFDIPFLKEVEKQYGRSGLFRNIISFDLYKAVRPYKKLLGLRDLKLKTVECFCGVCREDAFGGDELIPVYEEYARLHSLQGKAKEASGNPENFQTAVPEQTEGCRSELMDKYLSELLLHNGEDIADMLPVMKMLSYQYLFDGMYELISAGTGNSGTGEVFDLKFRLKGILAKELYLEDCGLVISVSCNGTDLLEITVPVVEDELRLYLENYKDYYYLPAEDIAIHRSLGEFVERKNRVKATAQTCYIREKGKFIEIPENFDADPNVFRKERKGKGYIRFNNEFMKNPDFLKLYAMKILERFLA